MKLGCILKFFAIIIVILGTSFYLYDKYGKDIISDTTVHAKELAIQKIDKLIDEFTEKEIENPLKDKVAEMLKEVEKQKDNYSNTQFDDIINKFNKIIEDNNINEVDIEKLQQAIEKYKNQK